MIVVLNHPFSVNNLPQIINFGVGYQYIWSITLFIQLQVLMATRANSDIGWLCQNATTYKTRQALNSGQIEGKLKKLPGFLNSEQLSHGCCIIRLFICSMVLSKFRCIRPLCFLCFYFILKALVWRNDKQGPPPVKLILQYCHFIISALLIQTEGLILALLTKLIITTIVLLLLIYLKSHTYKR